MQSNASKNDFHRKKKRNDEVSVKYDEIMTEDQFLWTENPTQLLAVWGQTEKDRGRQGATNGNKRIHVEEDLFAKKRKMRKGKGDNCLSQLDPLTKERRKDQRETKGGEDQEWNYDETRFASLQQLIIPRSW